MSAAQPQPSATLEALWKVGDVAGFLSVSTKSVSRLVSAGELPCVRIGAAVRFRPEAVRAYVERLARPPATVTAIGGAR